MLYSHITIIYGINIIKLYRIKPYFVMVLIDSESSETMKSKNMRTVIDNILDLLLQSPDVQIVFHHKKSHFNKKQLKKINDLVNDTNDKIIDFRVIARYVGLLLM